MNIEILRPLAIGGVHHAPGIYDIDSTDARDLIQMGKAKAITHRDPEAMTRDEQEPIDPPGRRHARGRLG